MKRVYESTLKKFAIGAGISSAITIPFLLLIYLQSIGAINVTGYSGDEVCAGTLRDPCYIYVNFTALEDIYIYPMTDSDQGNTMLDFKPRVKDWKMERSWGSGWRIINLTKPCKDTTCGAPKAGSNVAYVYKFKKGQDYKLRITVLKENINETIKWSFGKENKGGVDPLLVGVTKDSFFSTLDYNYADLNYGEAKFTINNPFDKLDSKLLVTQFIKTKGRDITKFEYHIYNGKTEVKGLLPKGKYTVHIKAEWLPDTTAQSIDWIPSIQFDKNTYKLTDTITLSKREWAWWNSSWQYRINVTYIENQSVARTDELMTVTLTNLTNLVNCSKELRIVYGVSTIIPRQVISQSGTNCTFVHIVDSCGAGANISFTYYWNSSSATVPSYTDYVVRSAGEY